MIGSSRESYAGLRQRLDARREAADFSSVAGDLVAVCDLVGRDRQLRDLLSDSGTAASARAGLADTLLGGRICQTAVQVVVDAVSQRWSSPRDLLEALEGLAAQAAFITAEAAGSLDEVEAELFSFSRAVAGSSSLQMALTNPAASPQRKQALVTELLQGRSDPATLQILTYTLAHLRGRSVDSTISDLMDLAAEQRGRSVAEVRVARALDQRQRTRLSAALSTLQGRPVRLNVAVDPSVIGGAVVRIGNEVIDGSVATRLEQARRAVAV